MVIKQYSPQNYSQLLQLSDAPGIVRLDDFIEGFDEEYNNIYLTHISNIVHNKCVIQYSQFVTDDVKTKYPSLDFVYEYPGKIFDSFINYQQHPAHDIKHFVCSFNGAVHVGRKILVAGLHKFRLFNPTTCSKNFLYTQDEIDGHISDYFTDLEQLLLYQKFFDTDPIFSNTVYTFGHDRFNHSRNIYNLENQLTTSFLHIVSETIPTSYCPFVSEKSLYSVVTRGLFLSYAQPQWHAHVEKFYGFKRFSKIFDYSFDSIVNPVERLVALLTMVSKFKNLSSDDWRDLYLLEQDTIEHNYNHYFSGQFRKSLIEMQGNEY